MPVSLRTGTGGDTWHAQPKSASTFLSATARASSEHSFRVQAVEAEHTEGSLVALSQTVPLGMGGLRRSVQTSPFARRTLDHGIELYTTIASMAESVTGSSLLPLTFFEVLSHSFYYVAGPGQASSSSTWPSFSCSSRLPLTPFGGSRGRWRWRWPGCTRTAVSLCLFSLFFESDVFS